MRGDWMRRLVMMAGSTIASVALGQSVEKPKSADDAVHAKAGPSVPGVPGVGESKRVGGDMDGRVEKTKEGEYRIGTCRINTPLPEGYPLPTPPGAIEIKTCPSVRRAEVSGRMTPDIGMNIGFFPLFNHIKRRNIAMTAPVEIDYKGIEWNPGEGGDVKPDSWTMSFLYRKAEQGDVGRDEKDKSVRVVDTPAVTVLAMGRRGAYRFGEAKKAMETLNEWLVANPQWEKAGEPRMCCYNGPDTKEKDLWSEVQWPVNLAVREGAPREQAEKVPDTKGEAPASGK